MEKQLSMHPHKPHATSSQIVPAHTAVTFVGWANWVDFRCFLSFVFLGVARRLELSQCSTAVLHCSACIAHCQTTATGLVA